MTIDHTAAPPEEIARRLAPGESVVWWDRPIPALAARREINVGLLFGAFFFCFSLFWMSMASKAPGPFFLFGIPFVLVGLWLVSTPLRAYRKAPSAPYALTDRRALIFSGQKVRTFPLEELPFVDTESFADGNGHIEFYADSSSSTMGYSWGYPRPAPKIGFIGIADAERVARELLQLRERRRTLANPGALPPPAA